ncbi:hypothetical protein BpHYR1_010475 [Brachionus plicatilis]|uniref:Uncharacterized protein n=1 Tax=Brachionus plicatilis TaxID=10195 RepID=A0A3M7S0H9_BRAPC|nr:hypothetical protein BpHYR1_010475 [Brachionus plicatilis]
MEGLAELSKNRVGFGRGVLAVGSPFPARPQKTGVYWSGCYITPSPWENGSRLCDTGSLVAVDPICGVSSSPTNTASCKLGLDTETGNKHTNALVCCVAMRGALLLSVGSVAVVTGSTQLNCPEVLMIETVVSLFATDQEVYKPFWGALVILALHGCFLLLEQLSPSSSHSGTISEFGTTQ